MPTVKSTALFVSFVLILARQLSVGHGLLIHEISIITHDDAPQSVRLIWTSDQLVEETST